MLEYIQNLNIRIFTKQNLRSWTLDKEEYKNLLNINAKEHIFPHITLQEMFSRLLNWSTFIQKTNMVVGKFSKLWKVTYMNRNRKVKGKKNRKAKKEKKVVNKLFP